MVLTLELKPEAINLDLGGEGLDQALVLELQPFYQGPQGPSSSDFVVRSPTFTYTGEDLTRIDYVDGAYKLFTYSAGVLQRLDYVDGARTLRKDFVYTAGKLTSIVESIL